MENLARQTTVRMETAKSSGSGTIVRRQGQTYTVLTNWHVVAIVRGDRTIVTGDGLLHRRLGVPRRLDGTDLAIVQFLCAIEYKVAPISPEPAAVGEPLRSARFPAGAQVWAVARGFVELLLRKSLPQGYQEIGLKTPSSVAGFNCKALITRRTFYAGVCSIRWEVKPC
ncbi:serine protease [Microcoleus sp. C2C3]|uniref:serine protease n=1 Tax=unclassified Microcoleus TaxID=2642155 RepID=UPI002FD5782A